MILYLHIVIINSNMGWFDPVGSVGCSLLSGWVVEPPGKVFLTPNIACGGGKDDWEVKL